MTQKFENPGPHQIPVGQWKAAHSGCGSEPWCLLRRTSHLYNVMKGVWLPVETHCPPPFPFPQQQWCSRFWAETSLNNAKNLMQRGGKNSCISLGTTIFNRFPKFTACKFYWWIYDTNILFSHHKNANMTVTNYFRTCCHISGREELIKIMAF